MYYGTLQYRQSVRSRIVDFFASIGNGELKFTFKEQNKHCKSLSGPY